MSVAPVVAKWRKQPNLTTLAAVPTDTPVGNFRLFGRAAFPAHPPASSSVPRFIPAVLLAAVSLLLPFQRAVGEDSARLDRLQLGPEVAVVAPAAPVPDSTLAIRTNVIAQAPADDQSPVASIS